MRFPSMRPIPATDRSWLPVPAAPRPIWPYPRRRPSPSCPAYDLCANHAKLFMIEAAEALPEALDFAGEKANEARPSWDRVPLSREDIGITWQKGRRIV